MLGRVLSIAFVAGLVAGLLAAVLHAYKVAPLIHHAETYEDGGANGRATHDHEAAGGSGREESHEAWAPEDGIERTFYTAVTNIVAGIGFALLLVGAFVVSRAKVNLQSGVQWGLCGFIVFALAPAALLPPEVPGAASADLGLRQLMWLAIAFSTAIGLALFVFAKPAQWRAFGVIVIGLPLVFQAPHGDGVGAVPPELAAQFVAASLVSAAVFWAFLGAVSGYLFDRMMRPPPGVQLSRQHAPR